MTHSATGKNFWQLLCLQGHVRAHDFAVTPAQIAPWSWIWINRDYDRLWDMRNMMNWEWHKEGGRSWGEQKESEKERKAEQLLPICSQLNNHERLFVSKLEVFPWKPPWPEAANNICGANQNNHYDCATSFLLVSISRYFWHINRHFELNTSVMLCICWECAVIQHTIKANASHKGRMYNSRNPWAVQIWGW